MWNYNGKIFDDADIGDAIGFVYLITNLENDKKYVGKKLFTFKKVKKPLKGKKNKRHSRIESDWKVYFGSNKELLEDVRSLGEDKFTREILHLCKTKGTTSYYETKEILQRDALIRDDFYNQWIVCKIHRSQIK